MTSLRWYALAKTMDSSSAEHGQEQLVADVFAQAENFFAQPTLMKHSVYRNEETRWAITTES